MPTEDQFVTVPLNSGIQRKSDEFTNGPPELREAKNVANDKEIGAANFLPQMFDLTDINPNTAQRALVAGDDTICMIRADSRPFTYDKAGNSWRSGVTTASTSADIVGDFVITAPRPISEIAHGKADNFDVYAWLESDESGVEGAVCRFLVRAGGSSLGPFSIPVQNGPLVKFHAVCCTRGATEVHIYVAEEGASNNIFGYRIISSGSLTLATTIGGLTLPMAMDVVEVPAADPDRVHLLAVATTTIEIHHITAFSSVDTKETFLPAIIGLGIGIDLDGTTVGVVASSSPGLSSVHYDVSDFVGTVASDQDGLQTTLNRVTVRFGRDGFVGVADSRKTINGVGLAGFENVVPFSLSGAGSLNARRSIQHMRLTGDAYVDEDGGVILPLAFTKPNTTDPIEQNLTKATWPIDPAIVGYLFNLQSFNSVDDFALHPVARWGTDRVRTGWGRSKLSMPYAADPTTAEQVYGRALLDVTIKQRKTSATAVLSNGGSLVGTSLAQLFDGRNFMPACHLWRPEISFFSNIAGGNTDAGTYNYRAVFIWEDDTGLFIRSADSSPVQVEPMNGQRVLITVSAHQPPHPDNVVLTRLRCWLYATEDGLINYHLVTDATGSPIEADFDYLQNEFEFLLDDGAGDPSNPILTFQTVPPELTPHAPNGFYDVATVHNRVWGIDAEDRNRVWFSKIMGRFDAPEFNPTLVADFPEEDGELQGIGVLNANPVFFKKHTLWAVQGGEGPSNVVGFGRGYARPVKVAHSGCVNRRSIVSFPGGVVFHNGQALQLLNQSYQVQAFGQEIQPETLGGIIATSHIAARRELHFNFDDGAGGYRHYVYSYDVQLWSEWPDVDFSFIDEMVTANSRIFLLDGDRGESLQMKESAENTLAGPVADTDLGSPRAVPDMVIKTAFIRPNDRNAARRVREVLLEFKKSDAPASGSLGVVIDEEHGLGGKSLSWTAAEIATAYPNASAERVILRVVPEEQLESISVQLTIPVTLNLRPVSCSVLFGIEEGVQRRYPEGSSK